MRFDGKYLVAVALLATLAVAFGLAGTVMPVSESVSPQQSSSSSSSSVTHFINPPTYDSGWLDITDKLGQSFTLIHDLNTTEALVDVVGRQSLTGGEHKLFFGATYIEGWNRAYGGASNDHAYSVVQTFDGGYALAGTTDSFGAGGYDFWLVKTDVAGSARSVEFGFSMGLSMTSFTNSTITLYRAIADTYWNYVRVRIWTIEEPTWMFGDINQDGIVDVKDLAILSKNYGKTFSALSITGIIGVAGVFAYKKRKKQQE